MRQRLLKIRGLVLPALLVAFASAAHAERVMVGEDIYIGPDEVVDSVVCFACSVRVDGVVEDEVVVIAGSATIDGRVDGDVVVIAGGLKTSGPIDGDAVVIAGGAKLGADVGGDVVAVFGGIKLAPGMTVDGDAVAVLGGVAGLDRAEVRGQLEEIGGGDIAPVAISGIINVIVALLVAALFFYPLLVVLGFVVLREQRFRVLADTAAQRGGFSFLVGIGTTIVIFIASIIVALTFPVPIPVFLIYIAISIVGYCGVSYWVGRGILRNAGVLGAAFTGALLITFIQFIPIIGWLVTFMFWNIAIGSAVLSGFGTSVDWLLARSDSDPWSRPATG
jgi:hypothetical protein